MIENAVKQSPIFSEFNPEEANSYFSLCSKKVKPHVDTLYYSIFVEGDGEQEFDNMNSLLADLKRLRDEKTQNYSEYIDFLGLGVDKKRFSNYEYCLTLEEMYDIFVCSVLPNPSTPRIVVQLRTRSLILNGVCKSICMSYCKVQEILTAYGMKIADCLENRIDYAYHTNLIQSPFKFFSDEMLLQKLKSKLRLYHKVGNIGKRIEIDYVSFGNRKSNDVFVRIYNKSREVIEKNYKSFFIEEWLKNGLISQYDYYVYNKAYELKAYVTGCLVGRLDWYLEFGKNEDIKDELRRVRTSCYEKNDNTEQLREVVERYLPPVTLIMNVEFQTKRKFYRSMTEWMSYFGHAQKEQDGKQVFIDPHNDPIQRLFIVYALRSEFCSYLTEHTLSFVNNKNQENEEMCNWWKRIHNVTMEEYGSEMLKLFRIHEVHTDIKRAERAFFSSVVRLSLLKRKDLKKDSDFREDLSDVLCSLNDNDFYGFANNPDTGEPVEFKPKHYEEIKIRKKRSMRSIYK